MKQDIIEVKNEIREIKYQIGNGKLYIHKSHLKINNNKYMKNVLLYKNGQFVLL